MAQDPKCEQDPKPYAAIIHLQVPKHLEGYPWCAEKQDKMSVVLMPTMMASINVHDRLGSDSDRAAHYTSAVTVREVQDQLIAGQGELAVWLRAPKHEHELSSLGDFADDLELKTAVEYFKRRAESRFGDQDAAVELVLGRNTSLKRREAARDAAEQGLQSQVPQPRRSKSQWQERLELLGAVNRLLVN